MKKDWASSELEILLDYTQPSTFIVDSTEYNDNYETPVLTAGKSFIIGYTNEKKNLFKNLPAIIFDDFTTSIQFVNFPFKVKSSAMKILTPTSKYVDIKYVYYFMKTIRINFDTHKRYWISIFSKLQIRLAPLPEQRAIVGKIEQLFSDLDNGIANLKQARKQLKVYRQAVLKKAFEGELTKEWREKQTNLPSAEELLEQIKAEREKHYTEQLESWKQAVSDWEAKGKPGKKPAKPKKTKELPPLTKKLIDIPINWLSTTINSFLSLEKKGMTTGPFGTLLKKSEHTKDGIPVLGIENIGEGVFKMPNKIFVSKDKAKELSSFEVGLGDIIISRSGTVGEICAISKSIGKALISTNLIRVSLNRKLIDSKFFVYLFQGGNVRAQVRKLCAGSTRDFLNQTILMSITFPFPSKTEQEQIVSEIESRLSVCDNVETNIEATLQQSEALRQSILKKAFEGKLLTESELTACRLEPDYEPAEKLLQRIKSEKEEK